MKLGHTGVKTKTSGTSSPSPYNIARTAKAFEILSSGLYNDKVRAVIRELSCNAVDAHVAAGKKEEPFEVHLPTPHTPLFKITDYGTGLRFIPGGCDTCGGAGHLGGGKTSVPCATCGGTGDYDAVKALYCTYFASDKNDSDDFIGALGLGSKSPFAYILSKNRGKGGFTVTNRYQGTTRIYTAAITDEGYPTVYLMETNDTPGVPNGLEVQFPVEPSDFWEFENKAKSVFEFFRPLPKFNTPIDVEVQEYSVRTDAWGMRKGSGSLRAIQGTVQYNVGDIDISRLSEAQQKMVDMPLDLFFPIGDLNPAASRESLQLDEATITNILTRLDTVHGELMEEVKKKIDACEDAWKARLAIHDLIHNNGRNSAFGGLVNAAFNSGKLEFKNQPFTNSLIVNELDYHNISVESISKRSSYGRRKRPNRQSLFEHSEPATHSLAVEAVSGGVRKESYDVHLEGCVSVNTIFILCDVQKKNSATGQKYINHLFDTDTRYTRVIYISPVTKDTCVGTAMTEGRDILEKLGNPPSFLLSELMGWYAPQMKAVRVHKAYQKAQAKTFKCSFKNEAKWRSVWEDASKADLAEFHDPNAIKYYVATVDGTTNGEESTGFWEPQRLRRILGYMIESGEFGIDHDTPIFAVKKGAKVLKNKNFIPIREFILNRLNEIMTPGKKFSLSLHDASIDCGDSYAVLKHIAKNPELLSIDSPFRAFSLALNEVEKSKKLHSYSLMQAAKMVGFDFFVKTPDFQKMWEKTKKLYPLLSFCIIPSYGHDNIEGMKAVVNYLRMMDEVTARPTVVTEEEEEETVNA